MNKIQLQGQKLEQGKVYKLALSDNGWVSIGMVRNDFFIGMFDKWDAMSDYFSFKADDGISMKTFIIRGDEVLAIAELVEQETNSEADPSGLDAHQPGAKLDAGKIYADAIISQMARAIWGVAEVGTFGANKYSLGGWTSVEDGIRRYRDAAARHRLKRQIGETVDPDSGLPHTYHEAWNVLAALELELRED